ncbi:hypothetical protein F511_32252 [Dorcoceras hygrometricum]|uniref:DUF674 domain-containing protein n=1 Tax=Dorcoceras hygrometricum TaxID=472368 RepID=A0A2Z7CRT8_9LAMI|nr:hypothetical protein F511_32252 [Dorcoceras hygrometricum]
MASSTVSLKLLIDGQSKRVLFAEASKETVDFLFSILSLPVASIINLLRKQGMEGSLANLYESIENLNESYIQPNQTKDAILKPTPPVVTSCFPLLLTDVAAADRRFYRCCSYAISDNPRAICPNCKRLMTTAAQYVSPPQEQASTERGFVKGVVTYMILDNLVVKPMSTISCITLLNDFDVKEVGGLQEKEVKLGLNEATKLLKASLQSEKPKREGSISRSQQGNRTFNQAKLKKPLLKPGSPVGTSSVPLLPMNAKCLCKSCASNQVSDDPGTTCPQRPHRMKKNKNKTKCSRIVFTAVSDVDSAVKDAPIEGGFVNGVVTYIIMDNLVVHPMSSISVLSVLDKSKVKDVRNLQEKGVIWEWMSKTAILNTASSTVSLKLLIDGQSKRVLFAEASKETVDFLFSILTLPVATVINLLRKQGMPRPPAGTSSLCLLLTDVAEANRRFYRCGQHCGYGFSDNPRTMCPACYMLMTTEVQYVSPPQEQASTEGGFVKGVVTYMILDNLVVKPMSTISCIALLNDFNVKEVGALQEKEVKLGLDEVSFLPRSFFFQDSSQIFYLYF